MRRSAKLLVLECRLCGRKSENECSFILLVTTAIGDGHKAMLDFGDSVLYRLKCLNNTSEVKYSHIIQLA